MGLQRVRHDWSDLAAAGNHENTPLRSWTAGSVADSWPQCWAIESTAVFAWRLHCSQAAGSPWLSTPGIHQQAHFWETYISSDDAQWLRGSPVAWLHSPWKGTASGLRASSTLSFLPSFRHSWSDLHYGLKALLASWPTPSPLSFWDSLLINFLHI